MSALLKGRCATCRLWLPCPTKVPGCDREERICFKSKMAGYGFYGQDGRAVITPEHFGCIEWQAKDEKGKV